MRINNGNPLDLSGEDGEVIDVAVASCKAKVALVLNGKAFIDAQFTLDKSDTNPFQLAVGGVFIDKESGGGAFSVSLSGKGVTATQVAEQFLPKEARRAFVFTVDIS